PGDLRQPLADEDASGGCRRLPVRAADLGRGARFGVKRIALVGAAHLKKQDARLGFAARDLAFLGLTDRANCQRRQAAPEQAQWTKRQKLAAVEKSVKHTVCFTMDEKIRPSYLRLN